MLLLLLLLLPTVAQAIPFVLTPYDAARGALLFGAGDGVAQSLEHHIAGRSLVREASEGRLVHGGRLVRATAIGTFYGGVVLPAVYQLAESVLPGRSIRNVLLKTCISCGLLSTGGNYYSLALRRILDPAVEGPLRCVRRLERCLDSVHDIFVDVLLEDLKIWPLYDVLCFAVVPPSLRPTATAVVSVCWHTYVSIVANRPRLAAAAD
jgi:hypothetical protein